MSSYVFDIGEKARKVSRFIGEVRSELQNALSEEKAYRKLTQQDIATLIGVNRSVINRQLIGRENLTLRSVAELAWALGRDIEFRLHKPVDIPGMNHIPSSPPKTETKIQAPEVKENTGSNASNMFALEDA